MGYAVLLQLRADRVYGPLLVRELAGGEFGIDEIAVDGEFEAAAAAGDELHVFELLLVGREQLRRQTDGLRFVVSHRAVLELYFHVRFPPVRALIGTAPL